MVANTNPIFTLIPKIGSTSAITVTNTVTTAAAYDGTTNTNLLFTAEATDGSFVQKIVAEAFGTNIACVARIIINNGSTPATATNNSLYTTFSLPATTAANNTATAHIEIPLNIQLPPSYRIYISIGAASSPLASGWQFTALGGDY
jgi:hypothetical protein